MNSSNNPNSGEINIGLYLRVIRKRRGLILAIPAIVLVLSVVISLFLPKTYAAKASILPSTAAMDPGLSAVSSSLGSFAGSFLNVSSPMDVWVGILESDTVKDAIIMRFNLREVYGRDKIEKARKELSRRTQIEKSKEEIISIIVDDSDPERASQMANAYIEELDRINRNSVMTSGGRSRTFIGDRLLQTKKDLAKAEEEINAFQKNNNAIKLDAQSSAMIESYSTFKGALVAKEIELETLLAYANEEHHMVKSLRAEITELRKKTADFERGNNGDLFLSAAQYPDLSLKYARLLRDAKTHQAVYEMLTQQYEMSSLQAAKDTPTLQVLDVAKVPEKESKPQKAVIVLMSTAMSLFFSVFLAFFFEFKETLYERIGL